MEKIANEQNERIGRTLKNALLEENRLAEKLGLRKKAFGGLSHTHSRLSRSNSLHLLL